MASAVQKFNAKYKVLELIAEGGYGCVYAGMNKSTKENVAIKKILLANYDNTDLPRLAVELALSKRLSHKHIIKCYDVYQFEKENEARIVMEQAKGEELFALIQSQSRLPETFVQIILHQILTALDYLHKQKIIFRDLKPENLLLKEPYSTGRHHILLCDFGLAVVKGEEKAFGAFGSVYYIAPEALLPREYDERVDVWAVGVVAHACFTGFPPFCADSGENSEIIKLIQESEVDFDIAELQTASGPFLEFLKATLQKNQDNRVTTSAALTMPWIQEAASNQTALNSSGAKTTNKHKNSPAHKTGAASKSSLTNFKTYSKNRFFGK